MSLFDWAPFRSTKAAVKLHTLLDLRGSIPAFIHISDGKLADVKVLDMLSFEPGAFYVMDRGYVDFARLYSLHQAGAFFVTRAMSTMDVRRVYSATSDRTSGVIWDQRVMLNGFYSARNYPEHLRRIRFRDPESGKTLVFLTNNTALPALRRLRPCTRAVGSSSCSSSGSSSTCASSIPWHQRGVKTQVWCAVATYVLIAIVVERAHRTRWPIDQAS